MCVHSRSRVDLDSQKRREEQQIIVELALIEHAHVGTTFRASFVHRTVATCHGSAIGCWNSKKTRKLLPTEETVEIDTDYLDNHGTNVVVCGPWKTHAVLLCLILITTVLMHPVCTGAPDHGHAVTSKMIRVGHNFNSALAKTDTSTSHIAPQCLHALLIIGGVELNPGPVPDR